MKGLQNNKSKTRRSSRMAAKTVCLISSFTLTKKVVAELAELDELLQKLLPLFPHFEDDSENDQRSLLVKQMKGCLFPGQTRNSQTAQDNEKLEPFLKLKQREREIFLQVARTCVEQNETMTLEHLKPITGMLPDEPPIHVDVHNGKDKSIFGTERCPVATLEAALNFFSTGKVKVEEEEEDVAVVVKCDPRTCKFLPCSSPKCKKKVCISHASGKGFYRSASDNFFFLPHMCDEPGCSVAACEHHYPPLLRTCETCEEKHDEGEGEGELKRFCKSHLYECENELPDEGDSEGDEDGDEDGYEKSPKLCEKLCCENCLSDHQCGS